MAQTEAKGIIRRKSKRSVDETVRAIKEILAAKGIQLFAEIDHSGEAEKVGMQLRPTKLLIFGNAKAGTPLMQAVSSTALDLPLKILISEEPDGQAWMSYNSGAYLQQRHNFPPEFLKTVDAVGAIAEAAAG